VTPEQVQQVEDLVNDVILGGTDVVTEVLPIEEARKKGAIAVFGEKYGQVVRVVEMGDFSIEFCGGTHLDNTAKAGYFHIRSESSVASGVRRIEATTGKLTIETMERANRMLHQAAQFFKTSPDELMNRIEQQYDEMRELRRELDQMQTEASLGEARQFLMASRDVKGVHVVTAQHNGLDAAGMRKMGDFLRDKDPAVVGVLASVNGEKVTFLAVCGKEAVSRGVRAGDLVRTVCAVCGGKGGGKPDSAMGGGSDVMKVDDALAVVDDFVAGKLG
jgi:alanyl-tRNA synthetase